jgi:beta-lactamase superfamily II metal-dependent hydrolase
MYQRKNLMRSSILLLLLPLIISIPHAQAEQIAPNPTASFISVGQGDAILIRDGAGFDALVDGGRKSAGEAVLAYLRQVGVDDLEVLLATHADSDHVGGLIDVLDSTDIPVEAAYFNGYPGDTQTWAEFEAAVSAEGLTLTPAQYPASVSWGSAAVEVLNPEPGLAAPDQNEASVVLMIGYAQINLLLTADVDASVESLLPGRTASLQAEILKVAHHGSKFSSSEVFLAAVQPSEAIISVGPNAYGHPSPEAVARLSASGARLWRTDFVGTVTAVVDGEGFLMLPRLTFLPVSLFGMDMP